ncbi:MAG TPA: lipoyl synthase [Acidobacteriota bacterium]|nr:lipoyl synthase [Acidobacteriota bacterium]
MGQQFNRATEDGPPRGRKPDWLKVRAIGGPRFGQVSALLKEYGLNTVCQAANCPNRGECFGRGTATFLILGPICTRNCRFCDVPGGTPVKPDATEPARVALAARRLGLRHVVVTSVTRDDLPDGGAGQFAGCIEELRRRLPQCTVEVLTPDFKGVPRGLDIVMSARPDVFNHNVETVERLYPEVRPAADYRRSLQLLQRARREFGAVTKSGLMVGLGETRDELTSAFVDLAEHSVTILTIGQYLSPSSDHLPVVRYVPPEEFELLGRLARDAGIPNVQSGPLVRSSYRADRFSPDS